MPQGWEASAGGASVTREAAAAGYGHDAMSELSRHRDTSRSGETWLVFLDGIHIGTIGRRAGALTDAEQWGWHCGFLSGS